MRTFVDTDRMPVDQLASEPPGEGAEREPGE